MARTIDRLMEKIDRKLMGEKSLRIQVDLIVSINILCTVIIAVFYVFDVDFAWVKDVPELQKIKETFIVFFSCFASFMMILAWLSSEGLSKKHVKDGNFDRPELDLIWACWAIVAWQVGSIMGLFFPDSDLASSFFSSLNNMFFLWAASDFVIKKDWFWHKTAFYRIFQDRALISVVTIVVIILSVILISSAEQSDSEKIQLGFLPDLVFSFICVVVLMLGFICVFHERYLSVQNLGSSQRRWVSIFKRGVTYFIILTPFLFTAIKMFILVSPPLEKWLFQFLHANENNATALINLYYKTTLILLFLSLEISWVRQKVTEKDAELNIKTEALVEKENNVNKLHKDLDDKEGKISKNLREIHNLKNEISHRFKNHLEALSLEFDRQIHRYANNPNAEITSVLTSIRGRIEATLLVHAHLDNKKVEEVNFAAYLKELCEKLRGLFFFPEGGFTFHIDERTLDREISFGDARGIGIAMTEIIINVDQHAYPNPAEKYLHIHAALKEDLRISIEDRGQGFKDKEKKDAAKGKGIPFVKSIIKDQLFGEVVMTDRNKHPDARGHKGVLTEIIIPAQNLALKKNHMT